MLGPSLGPFGNAGGESHNWSGHFCEPGITAMGNGRIFARVASAIANTLRATKGDALAARAKGGKS